MKTFAQKRDELRSLSDDELLERLRATYSAHSPLASAFAGSILLSWIASILLICLLLSML